MVGTLVVILGSALLALASLRGFAAAFLGPPAHSIAWDLEPRERWVVAALAVALVVLGVFPGLFLDHADAWLRAEW